MVRTKKNVWIIIAVIMVCVYTGVSLLHNIQELEVMNDNPANLMELAEYVVPGRILDCNGEIICQGSGIHEYEYADDATKEAFQAFMGTEDMEYSKRTLLGVCAPYLLGAYDSRFDMNSLLQPQEQFVGGDVETTLDKTWMEKTCQLLKKHYLTEDGAVISVVVSDYTTGDVKVLASNQGLEGDVCIAPLVTELKEGSVSKIADAMICLEIDPSYKDFETTCTGSRYQIRCTHDHGKIGLKEALGRSCNSYFIEMMNDCYEKHPEEFKAKLDALGFGDANRFVCSQINYVGSVFSAKLDKEQISLAAIGQGASSGTTFSAHLLTQAVLNKGVLKAPVLIREASDRASTPLKEVLQDQDKVLCSEDTSDVVLKGLQAITNKKGTLSSMSDKKMIGKTGTAQRQDGKNNIWFSGTIDGSAYCITVSIAAVSKDVTSVRAAELAEKILTVNNN